MTQPQRVESLSHAQRERLAYIDFRLYFFGEIGRPDLIERFGVAPAGATRDLALYREIAPQNITFDGSNKIYRIGQAFSPLFDHASQRVLSALALGFGDGVNGVETGDPDPDPILDVDQLGQGGAALVGAGRSPRSLGRLRGRWRRERLREQARRQRLGDRDAPVELVGVDPHRQEQRRRYVASEQDEPVFAALIGCRL